MRYVQVRLRVACALGCVVQFRPCQAGQLADALFGTERYLGPSNPWFDSEGLLVTKKRSLAWSTSCALCLEWSQGLSRERQEEGNRTFYARFELQSLCRRFCTGGSGAARSGLGAGVAYDGPQSSAPRRSGIRDVVISGRGIRDNGMGFRSRAAGALVCAWSRGTVGSIGGGPTVARCRVGVAAAAFVRVLLGRATPGDGSAARLLNAW